MLRPLYVADPTEAVLSALVTRLGYGTFELFSFTAIGIPVRLIGACYLLIAGRCLPDRGDQIGQRLQPPGAPGSLDLLPR